MKTRRAATLLLALYPVAACSDGDDTAGGTAANIPSPATFVNASPDVTWQLMAGAGATLTARSAYLSEPGPGETAFQLYVELENTGDNPIANPAVISHFYDELGAELPFSTDTSEQGAANNSAVLPTRYLVRPPETVESDGRSAAIAVLDAGRRGVLWRKATFNEPPDKVARVLLELVNEPATGLVSSGIDLTFSTLAIVDGADGQGPRLTGVGTNSGEFTIYHLTVHAFFRDEAGAITMRAEGPVTDELPPGQPAPFTVLPSDDAPIASVDPELVFFNFDYDPENHN